MYAIGTEVHQLIDSTGLCALYVMGNTIPVAELIAGVTGWDFKWPEALKTGQRILTLRQAFNAREGLTPDKFELPERVKKAHTIGPGAGIKIDFEALKEGYFAALGRDLKSGKPYPKTLIDLGLYDLTKDLWT